MTDRKELESLKRRMDAAGALVGFFYDREGHIEHVQVLGAKGIGTSLMSPLSAAERMREWLYNHAA